MSDATGSLGARSLNGDLQIALNPNMAEKIERFGSVFAPGDKVMQTENDYDREVFNGDLGRVRRIDQTEGVLIVDFDGREVEYPFGELDALVPAVRDNNPQVAGLRIPRRGDHAGDATLHYARQKSRLHGCHTWQAPRRHRRATQGAGHRGSHPWIKETVDKAPGMAVSSHLKSTTMKRALSPAIAGAASTLGAAPCGCGVMSLGGDIMK